jgi:hypothetical protein
MGPFGDLLLSEAIQTRVLSIPNSIKGDRSEPRSLSRTRAHGDVIDARCRVRKVELHVLGPNFPPFVGRSAVSSPGHAFFTTSLIVTR